MSARRENAKAVYLQRELDAYKRAFEDDHYPALMDALWLCGANDMPMPEWVWREAGRQLETAYQAAKAGGKRGRAGGKRAAAETNRVHYFRWAMVKHWIDNPEELPPLRHKATKGGAFAFASELLRGTQAQGTPRSIEDSYDKVEKAIAVGDAARFFAAGDDIRR